MDATELAYAGAAQQARLIAAGEVSAREVVGAVLRRIERLDPQLNAFRVVLAERALAEADRADARRGGGEHRPLLGVPVAIKDDTDVAGVPTARGTAASDLTPRAADAEVVRRLREAGAVIVGKTNVPELMMWPWTESVSFGAARNPWALDRTPGGSSGGSGAAVAAGLCGVALGTDGAGSIRIPAAYCGLFGLKPQRGRVPLAPGTSEGWHGMNHARPPRAAGAPHARDDPPRRADPARGDRTRPGGRAPPRRARERGARHRRHDPAPGSERAAPARRRLRRPRRDRHAQRRRLRRPLLRRVQCDRPARVLGARRLRP